LQIGDIVCASLQTGKRTRLVKAYIVRANGNYFLFVLCRENKIFYIYEHNESDKYEQSKVNVCMKNIIAVLVVLVVTVCFCGCIGYNDNYSVGHNIYCSTYQNDPYCQVYYENITVVSKDRIVEQVGFGEQSVYIIASSDKMDRYADSLYVYSKLIPNNTYTILTVDKIHCGYGYHKVVILDVVK
jgi:hypothetical protein